MYCALPVVHRELPHTASDVVVPKPARGTALKVHRRVTVRGDEESIRISVLTGRARAKVRSPDSQRRGLTSLTIAPMHSRVNPAG